MLGDRARPIRDSEAELAINPRDFNALARLGRLYREDGRLDEAAPLLERAASLRPHDTGPLFELAQLIQARGDDAGAVRRLEQVVSQTPDFIAAHVLLARLYYKLKRTAEAERERAIVDRLNAAQQAKEPGVPKP